MTHPKSAPFWLPLLLILVVFTFQVCKLLSPGMELLPNFSPWMALVFTGTLVMPVSFKWWFFPLCLLFLHVGTGGASSVLHPEALFLYGFFGLVAKVAAVLRGRVTALQTLVGCLAFGLVFYLLSNSMAWLTQPEYAKSFSGFLQAQTMGLPQYPPSWTFLRNSLISDFLFSLGLIAFFKLECMLRSIRLSEGGQDALATE